MEEIHIVDTTLRDGNTSLWAHNMTTGMMAPVLPHMDQAGFDAMEFFVGGRLKKVVREQRDNPWDWAPGFETYQEHAPSLPRWHQQRI
jgi:oxaloacetate decarboxylase alpha subunit